MDLPRQLGAYRLVRRLGSGGMAEVFLAVAYGASGFEKLVAIKTLLPELQGDATFEQLLIDEARVAARLSHRNLVQVHELGSAGGQYFVRMDYVDGVDLARALGAGAVSEGLALAIVSEVALALAAVHHATDEARRPLGLVHRDVSPSNILLSRQGDVKLADFGIAKATLLADRTAGAVRKGKYAYMSPEQVAGDSLDARSDQFGLAVTLVEMLTGRRPFDGGGPLETMERIREAAPPPLEDVAPDVRALVHRALARSPADRFSDIDALQDAVETARTARSRVPARALGSWVEQTVRSST
ncbi:MAG: serine/threonine-protein kinase [Deltaproteobacteria bacterium]